ncbi:hypothetical protein FPSE5266_08482 [Fusarium pseudograminearum]|nr:hypothetical protein FPSE5266_08482 [Fusarium pseudograminearum]
MHVPRTEKTKHVAHNGGLLSATSINNPLRPKQLNNHHIESSSRKIFPTIVVVKLVVSHSMHRMPRNRAKNNSAGPSGQSAPVVPPAPKFIDFRDDKSYAEAKAAWHVARAEYNRYQAVYYETAAKRHREWLQSDIEAAAKLEEEEANEPSIEELIAQAQAEIEAKKAAIGVANEPPKNDSKRVVIDSSAVQ